MGKQLIIGGIPGQVKTISKFLGKGFRRRGKRGPCARFAFPNSLWRGRSPKFLRHITRLSKTSAMWSGDLRAASLPRGHGLSCARPGPRGRGHCLACGTAHPRSGQEYPKRIQFNGITERAVKDALAHPRELNETCSRPSRPGAYLTALPGYKISPALENRKARHFRQAASSRWPSRLLIVERELEREALWPRNIGPSMPLACRWRSARIQGRALQKN